MINVSRSSTPEGPNKLLPSQGRLEENMQSDKRKNITPNLGHAIRATGNIKNKRSKDKKRIGVVHGLNLMLDHK